MIEDRSPTRTARALWRLPLSIVWLASTLASTASAKAPTLEHLFPGGGSRGSTIEVTAGGQFERWPVRVWTSTSGLTITPGLEKGKLTVRIAADLPPGLHWIRLFDDEGATHPRPFLVGRLPEVNEVEPNDEPAKAQVVPPSGVTVNGQLGKTGDVDGFRVALRQGQTLVAVMEANRTLGSPMDGVLQVASNDGFVLGQVDDELDRDPRIVFKAPKDGDFLIRAFAFPFVQGNSIQFAGSPAYVYRLTLTTQGIADHPFPLALTKGVAGEVEPIGWNIAESDRRIAINDQDDQDDQETTMAWPSTLANSVEVRRVDDPTKVEAEPNDRAHPQAIAWPLALSGRIDRPGDVDVFSFVARKDEKLWIQIDSRELGLPLDGVLRVLDATGATLVEVDDAKKAVDPEVRFTPPADGTYRVEVRDLNRHGGPNFAYLLMIGPPRPDFRLTLKSDPILIKPSQPFDLVVQVERREGYAEPIEVGLEGRHDGLVFESVVSKKSGPTSGSVTLKLRACDCVRPGPIRVSGLSADGRLRSATVAVPGLNRSIDSTWLTPARSDAPKPNP